MKVKKNYNVDDAINFTFDRNQSDLLGLSLDDEENDEIEDAVRNSVSNCKLNDAVESDNDITLASLAATSNQSSSNDQDQANNEPAERTYRWRKKYTIVLKKQ